MLKTENATAETVEFIYELDRKIFEKSKEKERKLAVSQERMQQSISDKLFALGGVDYVNTVVQSDEIS